MSDEPSQPTPQRPAPDGFAAWPDYWKAQGTPWRTEPAIDEERQRYLAERRAIKPDIQRGIYPFRDENGSIKLTRADIEWLLATHESGGMRGPVDWRDGPERVGVDLRGADLRNENLSRLPLARVQAGLSDEALIQALQAAGTSTTEYLMSVLDYWANASQLDIVARLDRANLAEAHLEEANLTNVRMKDAILYKAYLQGAILCLAHLEAANLGKARLAGALLYFAKLERTDLVQAHLAGEFLRNSSTVAQQAKRTSWIIPPADLRHAFLSARTTLNDIVMGNEALGFVPLADVQWNGVNLAVIDWTPVKMLGDECIARKKEPESSERTKPYLPSGGVSSRKRSLASRRLDAWRGAVRANRQLSTALRSQGLNEDADRFAYRAQVLQREVLRRQGIRKWLSFVGSLLLDALAGYGYRPGRSILVYLAVIVWFANLYAWAAHGLLTFGLAPSQLTSLPWYEALVLSMSSFHGRGFFQPLQSLGDPIAILAAIEAVFGLIIEVSFIATFTQRFFAR